MNQDAQATETHPHATTAFLGPAPNRLPPDKSTPKMSIERPRTGRFEEDLLFWCVALDKHEEQTKQGNINLESQIKISLL